MSKTKVFFRGSRTYFWSSVFFPSDVRNDVFTLYAFVRKADDFVDCIPQQKEEFLSFRKQYESALKDGCDDPLIADFLELKSRLGIPDSWIDAFFDSMQADLDTDTYETLSQLEEYIFGSAEVIGLCMNRIMGVDEKYDESAKALGRAMQLINFVRDISEDNELGRTYIPADMRHGLADLTESTARASPHAFKATIHSALAQYEEWMQQAQVGLDALPKRCRIPVATAACMYDWTAHVIEHKPFVVFEKKVKPSKLQVLLEVIRQSFR